MPKRRKKSVPPFLVELDNRTEIPSEFIYSTLSWVLAFLRRTGMKPQRRLVLKVRSMKRRDYKCGVSVIRGHQLEDEVMARLATDQGAYPASGRYTTFPHFPEYVLSCPADALVAILTHELVHWHCGVIPRHDDAQEEFWCEVLSSAAVTDYRHRYDTGKICSKP